MPDDTPQSTAKNSKGEFEAYLVIGFGLGSIAWVFVTLLYGLLGFLLCYGVLWSVSVLLLLAAILRRLPR